MKENQSNKSKQEVNMVIEEPIDHSSTRYEKTCYEFEIYEDMEANNDSIYEDMKANNDSIYESIF